MLFSFSLSFIYLLRTIICFYETQIEIFSPSRFVPARRLLLLLLFAVVVLFLSLFCAASAGVSFTTPTERVVACIWKAKRCFLEDQLIWQRCSIDNRHFSSSSHKIVFFFRFREKGTNIDTIYDMWGYNRKIAFANLFANMYCFFPH